MNKVYVIIVQIIWIFIQSQTAAQDDYYNHAAASGSFYGAPLIEPSVYDVTLDYHSKYLLQCESQVPIAWVVPSNVKDAIISQSSTGDEERPYGTVVEIHNVTAHHVGEYFCVNNDSLHIEDLFDLKNEFKASSIYVFVEDPHILLTPVESPVISAVQYADIIIPCKPTSKKVNVTLTKDEEESTLKHISYDPQIGFTEKALTIGDSGIYSCIADNDTETLVQFHLYIMPSNSYISRPTIDSPSNGHAAEGETFTLECKVDVISIQFVLEWTLPNDNQAVKEGRATFTPTRRVSSEIHSMSVATSILTVKNANRITDQGPYKCEVSDHSKKAESNQRVMFILASNESYIDIKEPGGKYTLNITRKTPSVRWMIAYAGYPPPELEWYDNFGNLIPAIPQTSQKKYVITKTKTNILFEIHDIEVFDNGEYKLKAYNDLIEKELKVKLIVRDKPSVIMESVIIKENEEAVLKCNCLGFPASTISWTFTPCSLKPSWPNCSPIRAASQSQLDSKAFTNVMQAATIKFKPTDPGIVTCQAVNDEGRDETTAEVLITDLNHSLDVWGLEPTNPIAIGDSISIICGTLAYNFTGELQWYRDFEPVEASSDISFADYYTKFSYRKAINFKKIKMIDAGTYECMHIFNDSTVRKEISVDVHVPVKPSIYTTTLSDKMGELGEPVRFECSFIGIPIPIIQWFKDDSLISINSNETRITIHSNNTVLDFQFIREEDHATYKCEGSNRIGSVYAIGTLKIKNLPSLNYGLIAGITLGILFLIIAIMVYLCFRIKKLKERKASGLNNFVNGCVEQINPALSLDEQADLLPYDKKYEFPRDRLKLGPQLGAGAFGVVVKGVAQNIHPYEEETIVAVKTIKQNADNEVLRALISELKIMIHMGQHLNVVNLLGAITKNIDNREVMLIVEYCRFGNVQNFLLKHREFYVDQLNPETGEIDHTILSKEQREQRWSNDSGYEYNSKGNQRPGSHLNSSGYTRHSQLEYFPGGVDSSSTEAALISTTGKDEGFVLTNNSVQPAWRSNYKMDYVGPARLITTSDLVSWSFQVARGMEYLSSRKVLHGDLAARNILLCDDNVVKICDFGLARSMYKNDNYKKKGESPLPFKWLAIESISDQVFSQYSDVWAFGIVLWELFSLSKVPYPGMNADQTLYNKLQNGYRMEKPGYANQELYDLMLNCWNAKPESRPLFTEIEARLGKMLEDGVKDHYIDLNEPYLQMNADMFSDGQKDYLTIMGPPEGLAPAIPTYVNGNIHAPALDIESTSPGYLRMSPTSGNVLYDNRSSKSQNDAEYPQSSSPTIMSNLDTNPQQKSRKKPGIPEEIPMLKNLNVSHSDSDSDTSPDPKKLNQQFTELGSVEKPIEYKNITADNYVNVPSKVFNKPANNKDAFSNPGYVTIGIKNENDK